MSQRFYEMMTINSGEWIFYNLLIASWTWRKTTFFVVNLLELQADFSLVSDTQLWCIGPARIQLTTRSWNYWSWKLPADSDKPSPPWNSSRGKRRRGNWDIHVLLWRRFAGDKRCGNGADTDASSWEWSARWRREWEAKFEFIETYMSMFIELVVGQF